MDDLMLLLAIVAFVAIFVFVVLGITKRNKESFKRAGISLIIAVVSFFGFIATYDEDAPDTNADDTDTGDVIEEVDASENEDPEEVEKPEEPIEEKYSLGELVNVGDVGYVVNSIDIATNVGGEWGENSQGTFLIIDITVTNNGNEPLRVNDSFFKLLNDEKEFETNTLAGIKVNDDDSFFLASINPDLSLTGKVVFDVSDAVIESTTKQLEVSTGYWGTETEVINLQ